MRKTLIQRLSLITAISCFIFFLLYDLMSIMNYPDYEWMRNAVSNLTAKTAPSFAIAMRYGSVFMMLVCLCAVLVFLQTRGRGNRRLQRGIALFSLAICVMGVGYALFPLDEPGYGGEPGGSANDFVHFYVVTGLLFLIGGVALATIALSGLREDGVRWISITACGTMLGLLLAGVGLVVWGVDGGLFGLLERIGVYGAVLFQAVLGIYVFRDRQPPREEVRAA